jgi:putative oxidoreductase
MTTHITFLRIGLAVIFMAHSVPGMFNNGVNDFGNLYLNEVGFSPFGLPLAWAIKLSHVALVISLLTNKYLKINAIITILVLLFGIGMIHVHEGWFVVGGGRNGVEFNFILIMCLLHLMYPNFLKGIKNTNF